MPRCVICATLTLFSVVGILSGCSQNSLLANASPGFADGYRAGCKTATLEASNTARGIIKDKKRYLNEPEYQKGWDSGERGCQASHDQPNSNMPSDVYDAGGVIGPGGQMDGESGVYP